MSSDNFGPIAFTIAAVLLAMSSFGVFKQRENFGAIEGSNPADVNTVNRYSSGPSFEFCL